MRAILVLFPIKGRNWCFSRSTKHSAAQSSSSDTPIAVWSLWKKIPSESKKPINANAELVFDFISDKMNRAWMGLEKAPEGSMKNKLHRLGLQLLTRVKPSEIFLKSISKEVTSLQVTYPSRGTILRKKLLIGSGTLLPLTGVSMVLPLPNIPLFWVLFCTYSHWRALQGSEKLLQIISTQSKEESNNINQIQKQESQSSTTLVLQPSKKLDRLLCRAEKLEEDTIGDLCKLFHLNKLDVLKYRDHV